MVCKSIGCDPSSDGLNVDALRLVYASEGANIGDYMKVFGKKETNNSTNKTDSTKDKEDNVLEIGENGVDMSSLQPHPREN